MKLERNLTSGTVWKGLFMFFLPIAAGTLIQQLYNAVDGMVVGKFVGTEALAAVGGSASQIINLLIGFFVALTAGASVVIAQIYGAGRQNDVRNATGNALVISLLIGLGLMVTGLIFSPQMLTVLKTTKESFSDSLLYLRIYFLGVPFILVLNMESNMLRAVGDSTTPFVYMIIGCLTNIVLDVVFVVIFAWGVAGVAVATVLAQVINMVLLSLKLFLTDKPYKLSFREFKIKGPYLSTMMRMGIPAGLQSSMYAVSNMIIQIGVNLLGTVVVASWAMSSKVDGFYWALTNALGTAITAFIGQNMGARKYDRMKTCVKQGLIMSLILTISSSVLIIVLGKPVLHILTDDPAVISTTFEIMMYFVPFYFTWTVIEVISAVLRGSGDAVKPVIIIGLGICLFRIVWMVTAFAVFKTLMVLSLSYVSSWVITDIALLVYYKKGRWMERSKNRILDK